MSLLLPNGKLLCLSTQNKFYMVDLNKPERVTVCPPETTNDVLYFDYQSGVFCAVSDRKLSMYPIGSYKKQWVKLESRQDFKEFIEPEKSSRMKKITLKPSYKAELLKSYRRMKEDGMPIHEIAVEIYRNIGELPDVCHTHPVLLGVNLKEFDLSKLPSAGISVDEAAFQ